MFKRVVDVRGPKYFPDIIFCVVPVPEDNIAAYMSTDNAHIICNYCNQTNFE